jgi:hypothetical protein
MSTRILQGAASDGSPRFAAIDPASRYVSPQVCRFRFSAALAPFLSDEAARAALVEAGCSNIEEARR